MKEKLIHTKRRAIAICPECGLRRPVDDYYLRQQKRPGLCQKCSVKHLGQYKRKYGKDNPRYKGGRQVSNGYVEILVSPDDFYFAMAMSDSRILEHRLVMAKHLGRCLHSWEIVHHKNHVRDDNRIENLQLVTDDRHKQITVLENRIRKLESRVTQLEAENVLLKAQTYV